MAQRVLFGLVALGAIVIAVAWGWGALVVYLFLVAIPLLLSIALNIGGDWLTRSSRGRFVDRNRS